MSVAICASKKKATSPLWLLVLIVILEMCLWINRRPSHFLTGEQTMTSAVCKLCSVQVLHNVNSFPCLPLQVIEDNTGVRRVVVTPQSPECYPPSYPSAISPTHHLPPYLAHHPHFIHNSHTAFYPPVTGPGDMPPQFFPQHHLPPTIYGEQGELGGGTGVSHLFSGGSKG